MLSPRLEALRNRCGKLRSSLERESSGPCEPESEFLAEIETAIGVLERRELRNGAGVARHPAVTERPAVALAPERADPERLEDLVHWEQRVVNSHDAIVTIDRNGTVLQLNRVAEQLLGCSRAEAVGAGLLALAVPERLREPALAALHKYCARPECESATRKFATTIQCADGSELLVDVDLIPHGPAPDGRLTLRAQAREAREGRLADAAPYRARLRTLMAELLVSEERERKRLADDLHDGLSQTLTLAQMKLAALRGSTVAAEPQQIATIEELVCSADRAARAICFELSPPVLHHFGLSSALPWLAENMQERYGITVELRDDKQSRTDDETCRVIVFRSIRELLVNAAKHAGVQQVRLELHREGDRLVVTVEDHGVGMAPNDGDTRGTGLLSMRERLAHVGGTLLVDSTLGNGTRVRLTVPTAPCASPPTETPS